MIQNLEIDNSNVVRGGVSNQAMFGCFLPYYSSFDLFSCLIKANQYPTSFKRLAPLLTSSHPFLSIMPIKLIVQPYQIFINIQSNIIYIHKMTNPFAALDIDDDEEDTKVNVVKAQDKPRRTHQDKKNYKKQQEEEKEKITQVPLPPLVQEIKEKRNHHTDKHDNKKSWVQKELTDGHSNDRRSGTGREDRPRKAGGGYGNVGNIKDDINQDKYAKEGEEPKKEGTETNTQVVPAAEVKPASPPKQTLDEYYKSKGVDLTYNAPTKAPVKKGEINADWIKKEKLIVLESKEDKKQQERTGEQIIKHNNAKGLDVAEETLNLGFGSKPTHSKQDDHRGEKRDHKGHGHKGKPHFNADDFPTL